jgi:hypothetical protein
MMNMPDIETSWRQAFDAVERPLATAAESWLQTDIYMDALAVAWRLRRRATRRLEAGAAAWLHLCGLPTRGDVVQVVNQLASLERELREQRS